jgi:hypothetical protein
MSIAVFWDMGAEEARLLKGGVPNHNYGRVQQVGVGGGRGNPLLLGPTADGGVMGGTGYKKNIPSNS